MIIRTVFILLIFVSSAAAQSATAIQPISSASTSVSSLAGLVTGYQGGSILPVVFRINDEDKVVYFEPTEVLTNPGAIVVSSSQGIDNFHPQIFHFKSTEESDNQARLSIYHDEATNTVVITGLIKIGSSFFSFTAAPIAYNQFITGQGQITFIQDVVDSTRLPNSEATCQTSAEQTETRNYTIYRNARGGSGYENRSILYRNAQLKLDADYEYVQALGSTANAIARIESTINLVNGIYDPQLHIRLAITALTVWDTPNDPFDSSAPPTEEYLHYLASGAAIPTGYDLAQLFTGRSLQSGSAIGQASLSGACTQTAVSAVTNINNTATRVTLTAHELGHLLGADHDTSGANIMFPTASTSTVFTQQSINQMNLTEGCYQAITDPALPPGLISTIRYYFNSYTQVTFEWDAPQTGGPLNGYQIFRSTQGFSCSGTPYAQVGGERFVDNITRGGLYYYSIKATSAQGDGECVNLAIDPPIFDIAGINEPTPSDFSTIQLIINTATGSPPIDQYTTLEVYRSNTNSACAGTPVTTIDSPTAFQTITAPLASYGIAQYFSVRSHTFGGVSRCSNVIALDRPTPVTANASQGIYSDRVQVSWASSALARLYWVYRFEVGNPQTQTTLGSTTNLSFTDTTAASDGRYYNYFVQACNASGCRDSTYALGYRDAIPAAPTGLIASDGTSTSSITLTWSPVQTGRVTGYKIYRSLTGSSGNYTLVGNPGAATTSFTDSAADIQYGYPVFYKVSATTSIGEGPQSSHESGYVSVPLPNALTITSVTEPNPTDYQTVTVAWSNTAGTESFFDIYISTAPQACVGTQIYRTGLQQTSYSIPVTIPQYGVPYYFSIRALNGAGAGPCSMPVAIALPQAASLSATQGTNANGVNLSWNVNSLVRDFIIQRRIASGSDTFQNLATVSRTVTSFSDTTAAADGTRYNYQILGCNVTGCTPSNQSDGWRQAPPSSPRTLAASDANILNAVDLSWQPPLRGNVDTYRLELATQPAGPFTSVANITGTLTSYRYQSSTYLRYGDTYYFRIIAVSTLGESQASNVDAGSAQVDTPGTPSALTITETSLNLRLNWTASGGAARFTVYRSTTPSACAGDIIAQGLTTNTFTDSTFLYGNLYYYSLRAINASGASACSTTVNLSIPSQTTITASDASSLSSVTLTISGGAGRATYSVRRSDTGLPGSFIEIANSIATSHIDTAAPSDGTTVWYQALGCNASGCSSGTVDTGRRAAPPPAAINVVASDNTFTDRVRIAWNSSSRGYVSRYTVQRSNSVAGTYIDLGNVFPSDPLVYDDLTTSPGITYYYRIISTGDIAPVATSLVDSGSAQITSSSSSSSTSSSLSSSTSSQQSSSTSSAQSSSSLSSSQQSSVSSSSAQSSSTSTSLSSSTSSSLSSSSESSFTSSESSSSLSNSESSNSSSSESTSSQQSSTSSTESNVLGAGIPLIPANTLLNGSYKISKIKVKKSVKYKLALTTRLQDLNKNQLTVSPEASCTIQILLQKTPRQSNITKLGEFAVTLGKQTKYIIFKAGRVSTATTRRSKLSPQIYPVLNCSSERLIGKAVTIKVPKAYSKILSQKTLITLLKKAIQRP